MVTLVLVIGSVAEIDAQSSGYRRATDAGYGALATRVVMASNLTGRQLASVMDSAPGLTNQALPRTARAVLQQGLDAAVDATAQEAAQAAGLVPPYPSDHVSNQLTQVMEARATGAADLRTSIDQLLGMAPLPVAGAPTPAAAPSRAPLISVGQATTAMGKAGLLFQQADVDYRKLTAQIRRQRLADAPAPIGVGAGPGDRGLPGLAPAGLRRLGAGELPAAGPEPPAGHHRGGPVAAGGVDRRAGTPRDGLRPREVHRPRAPLRPCCPPPPR